MLQPETMTRLLAAEKDLVSEIFWTQYWCNAWDYDQYSPPREEWRKPGLWKVGMTGACTLVRTEVFRAGVDYTPIPNIRKAVFGEDRHFCIRAACHGFEVWADSHCLPVHLYTEKHYDQYKAGELKTCFRK